MNSEHDPLGQRQESVPVFQGKGLLSTLLRERAPDFQSLAEQLTRLGNQGSFSTRESPAELKPLIQQLREVKGFMENGEPELLFVSSLIQNEVLKDFPQAKWQTEEQYSPLLSDTPPLVDAVAWAEQIQKQEKKKRKILMRLEEQIDSSLGTNLWRAEAKQKALKSSDAFFKTEIAELGNVAAIPPVENQVGDQEGNGMAYFLVRDTFSHDKYDQAAKAGGKFYLIALPANKLEDNSAD